MNRSVPKAKPVSLPPFNEAILRVGDGEILRVIQVVPLNEFRFRDFCEARGVVHYLPLQRVLKIHNVVRRGKPYTYSAEVLRPMFSSYVFVKTRLEELRSLYDSKLLHRILQPATPENFLEELRVIRIAETVGLEGELEVHKDIPEGARFLIQSGVWDGVSGWLSKKEGIFKWTVSIEMCDQMVTATIDPTQFRMIRLDE